MEVTIIVGIAGLLIGIIAGSTWQKRKMQKEAQRYYGAIPGSGKSAPRTKSGGGPA